MGKLCDGLARWIAAQAPLLHGGAPLGSDGHVGVDGQPAVDLP